MKDLKKIIIILVIAILILIISIYFINRSKKDIMDEQGNIEEPEYIEGSYEADKVIKQLENKEEYFIIRGIVEQLQLYINELDYDLSETRVRFNNTEEEEQFLATYKQEGINSIKNMMSKEYIQEFNVNDATIYNNLVKYANKDIAINSIYVSENSVNIKTFFVYLDVVADTNKEFNLVITLDSSNNSFYIMLEDYINKMKINKENIIGRGIEQTIQNIEQNEYNTYDIPNIDEARYVQELFENYKILLSNLPDKAYDLLDNEYKQKRFGNIQNFKNYRDSNSSYILDMELSKYKINHYNDYTEYICMNQSGNYIVFKEKKVMDYDVLLDNYTIDGKEFTEKYNKSNEQQKVGMNIEKLILALNSKDYQYVYHKLDDEFKRNNFDTIEKFESYIKQNIFDTNVVEYDRFSQEGKTYIYEIEIKASEENTQNPKTMTIIMKLLENTDYIVSFNIQS